MKNYQKNYLLTIHSGTALKLQMVGYMRGFHGVVDSKDGCLNEE